MSTVRVRFYAGAARAAGTEERNVEADTVGALRELLSAEPALAKVCAVAAFLVDGGTASDASQLPAGATVDVLPPFAGG